MKRLALCTVLALVLGLASGAMAFGVNLDNVPDGAYSGAGAGFNDDIAVDVVVDEGEVTDIDVTSQDETPDFWEQGVQTVDDIIAAQSTAVDTQTGATASSEGIVEAVRDALEGAEEVEPEEVPDVDFEIIFNDQALVVEAFIEDGRTYVDSESLEGEGFEVDEYPNVQLRQFFEDKGAEVKWDPVTRIININLVEEYDAKELLQNAGENMIAQNTFKMRTDGEMRISVDADDRLLSISEESVGYTVEEEFSIDPLKAYIKQVVEFPVLEFMSPDAADFLLPLDEEGTLELEVIHKDGETYSKLPQENWTQVEIGNNLVMLSFVQQVDSEFYSQWAEVRGIDISIGDEEEGAPYQAYELTFQDEFYSVIMEEVLQEQAEGINVESVEMKYELLANPATGLFEQLNEDINIDFSVCASLLELDKEGKIKFEFISEAESEIYDYGEDITIPTID